MRGGFLFSFNTHQGRLYMNSAFLKLQLSLHPTIMCLSRVDITIDIEEKFCSNFTYHTFNPVSVTATEAGAPCFLVHDKMRGSEVVLILMQLSLLNYQFSDTRYAKSRRFAYGDCNKTFYKMHTFNAMLLPDILAACGTKPCVGTVGCITRATRSKNQPSLIFENQPFF